MADWWTHPALLALDALAVYRLTRFVTTDHIPLGTTREWVTEHWPRSLLREWVHCSWCASMTLAVIVVGLHTLAPGWWPVVAAVLAFSAVTGLLATWEHQE